MKKAAGVVGIILTIVFLTLGVVSATPDKYIKSYGEGKMYEYVGGDAYNFMIEASLRGGEISGAKAARAIYFATAGILLVLSISFLSKDENIDQAGSEIRETKNTIKNIEKELEKLEISELDNQTKIYDALEKIIEQKVVELPQQITYRDESYDL